MLVFAVPDLMIEKLQVFRVRPRYYPTNWTMDTTYRLFTVYAQDRDLS